MEEQRLAEGGSRKESSHKDSHKSRGCNRGFEDIHRGIDWGQREGESEGQTRWQDPGKELEQVQRRQEGPRKHGDLEYQNLER